MTTHLLLISPTRITYAISLSLSLSVCHSHPSPLSLSLSHPSLGSAPIHSQNPHMKHPLVYKLCVYIGTKELLQNFEADFFWTHSRARFLVFTYLHVSKCNPTLRNTILYYTLVVCYATLSLPIITIYVYPFAPKLAGIFFSFPFPFLPIPCFAPSLPIPANLSSCQLL